MNRQLSAAVIASFRDTEPLEHRQNLRRFSTRQWQENFPWLDASGLALYFLDRLRTIEAENAIPDAILGQLEQRHADNEQRTTALFEEFARINAAFSDAGLKYSNLKGFTLVPEYCPNLSLRCQMDFDFLLGATQANASQKILRGLGYSLMASNAHVMEFKSHTGSVPHVRDLYKARPQHTVEIHICDDSRLEFRPGLLARARVLPINGADYPALAASDMFLGQASHLFRHIRSEWTRISWLLEFKHFVTSRRDDAAFWREVQASATQGSGANLAIGTALSVAEKAFGAFASHELRERTTESLPASVALWIQRYGEDVLHAAFPGSKLYLILDRELDTSREMAGTIRRRLLPVRGPARVTAAASASVGARFKAWRFQLRYFLFRLRFHLTQTPRYLWQAWQWKQLTRRPSALGHQHGPDAAPTQSSDREAGHKLPTSYRSLTVKQQ